MKISIIISLEKENKKVDKSIVFILDDDIFNSDVASKLIQQQIMALHPKLIESALHEINKSNIENNETSTHQEIIKNKQAEDRPSAE